MMFMTRYRTKPHMSKADLKDMMDLFGSVGEAPGTISHYVDADGGRRMDHLGVRRSGVELRQHHPLPAVPPDRDHA